MAVDSLGVLETLRGAPEQLATAHEAATVALDRADLPPADAFDHLVMMGMGGSGVVGDIVAAIGATALPIPVTVSKTYRVPAFVGPRTLAIAVSYSGDTEETVAMAESARAAGAFLVTMSSGGALAALGAGQQALHVPCTPGIAMPRTALGTMVGPVFALLAHLRLMPEAHAALVRAQEQLARRRDQCVPEIEGDRNPARELARVIGRTIPLIHGAGVVGQVAALRWKASINENAKAPAFWNTYPELDHNEICAWGQHGDVTRQVMSLIVLRHGFEPPRVDARVRITTETIAEAFARVVTVDAVGDGPLAQLLDLIALGDWASCYLALDNDVDPGPIDAIAGLKAALARQ